MVKGIFFTLDSVLALSVILIIISGIGIYYTVTPELEYRTLHSGAEDAMQTLSQSTVSYEGLPANQTALEAIGTLWVTGNRTEARNLTKDFLENLTDKCYELEFSGETVYSNCNQEGETIAVSNRIASGYSEKGKEGYISRGFLTGIESKMEKSYIYFGGYVGDGNITKNISLGNLDTIANVTMEMDVGGNFTLYVNGDFSGNYSPSKGNMTADEWALDEDYWNNFVTGENTVQFNFTGNRSFIAGGYLRVVYNTTGFEFEGETKNSTTYKFPGIDGVINLYSSFYSPGKVENITGKLHYKTNGTVFLRIANATIYKNQTEGDVTVTLDNSSIHSNISKAGLDYKALSNSTIPLRFGLEEIEGGKYRPIIDSASVIDVSGSMDGNKLDEAKSAAKTFSTVILNVSGNRVGMVSYESGVDDVHELTENETSINDSIEALTANGGTCIGCGILRAIDVLSEPKYDKLISNKSEWKYNTSFPGSSPPEKNGKNWTQPDYDDSSWDSNSTILGFGPDVDTDVGNNGGDYFFRKKFDYDKSDYNGLKMAVRSDDAATVYLNSHLVDNDTNPHNGTYWNRIMTEDAIINFESGGSGTDVDASKYCSVSGGSTWWGEYIEKVEFNGIDRTTGDNGGYIDVTDSISNISIPTKSYQITVTFNTGGYDEYASVAFDWDHDLDISNDPVYEIGHCSSNGCQVSANIKVPVYAETGSTLMRVMGEWNGYHKRPCLDPNYNEIEDYSVFVNGTEKGGINETYINDGKNIVAVRLKNDDSSEAEFDLKVEGIEKRNKSMVVMSDGEANVETSMENVPDHDNDGDVDAKDHTIEAGCRAKQNHSITVYAIGFGSGADNQTLNLTAQCGGGKYYFSETGELVSIFRNISINILELTFTEQTAVTGDGVMGELFRDSYLKFKYTGGSGGIDYGEIPLQFESDRFGGEVSSPKEGWFWVGNETKPLEARATSYSSNYWTSKLNLSNDKGDWNIYDLSAYGEDYTRLGDPYTVHIPPDKVSTGNNTVFIDTALSPTNSTGGSPDDKVIYTLAVEGSVPYGNSFRKYQGGVKTVETELGKTYDLEIGNTSDPWDPGEDALDDMVERLLERLDPDGDGKINVDINPNNINIEKIKTGTVPFLWGPNLFTLKLW